MGLEATALSAPCTILPMLCPVPLLTDLGKDPWKLTWIGLLPSAICSKRPSKASMLDLIWVSSVLMVCSSLLFTESGGKYKDVN